MPSLKRRQLVDRDRGGVYHCWNRCVRRAFLCGKDPATEQDFSHRRDWILTRQEQLAQLFAIDIEFHAEMRNHLHLVLRTRPDVAQRWSRQEVARRWLTITRLAKCMDDSLPQPQQKRILALAKDKKRIAKLRRRLSSISWWMGTLCENIARRANQEDDCKGRFWETRFKCRKCVDVGAIIICGMYVDLNALRAGEASSLQTSYYSSAYQRIQALGQRKNARDRADAWLGELTLVEGSERDPYVKLHSHTGRRASDLGLVPISLEDYLKLLQWTAEQISSGQRPTIPSDLEPILDHLSVRGDAWLETIQEYEESFCHIVAAPVEMAKAAERMGVHHLKGMPNCRRLFA